MNQKYQNNIHSLLSEDFKFITDASLGRLAKWLRLLGYDTVVFPNQAGREMLRQADTERRIVLTRRRDMTQRQFSGHLFLITGVDIASQLNDVIRYLEFVLSVMKSFIPWSGKRCVI